MSDEDLKEACDKMQQDFLKGILELIKEVKDNSVGIYTDEDVDEFRDLDMKEYMKFLKTGEGKVPRILREMKKS